MSSLLISFQLSSISSDFDSLSGNSALENCRVAFDAAAKLGIPRVLDAGHVANPKASLDLLSVMTYLHQIRTLASNAKSTAKATSLAAQPNTAPVDGYVFGVFT